MQIGALASRQEENLERVARAWGRERPRFYFRWEQLLEDPRVEAVYVSLPPFLHYPVGRAALEAGKHLLLEKPGALSGEHLREMERLARQKGRRAGVNFVMRQNPFHQFLYSLARGGLAGELIAYRLENEAHGDLPPHHWFWQREKSGGILVEHGIHFFDLLLWLGGEGEAGGKFEEGPRAAAVSIHLSGRRKLLAYSYHSFDRLPGEARAEQHFTFTRGRVVLRGWTPWVMEARLPLSPTEARALLLPLSARGIGVDVAAAPQGVRVYASAPSEEAVYREEVRASFRAWLEPSSREALFFAALSQAARALDLVLSLEPFR